VDFGKQLTVSGLITVPSRDVQFNRKLNVISEWEEGCLFSPDVAIASAPRYVGKMTNFSFDNQI